jgi:hypothetical protein
MDESSKASSLTNVFRLGLLAVAAWGVDMTEEQLLASAALFEAAVLAAKQFFPRFLA